MHLLYSADVGTPTGSPPQDRLAARSWELSCPGWSAVQCVVSACAALPDNITTATRRNRLMICPFQLTLICSGRESQVQNEQLQIGQEYLPHAKFMGLLHKEPLAVNHSLASRHAVSQHSVQDAIKPTFALRRIRNPTSPRRRGEVKQAKRHRLSLNHPIFQPTSSTRLL